MDKREFVATSPKANIVACRKVNKGEKKTYIKMFSVWEDGNVRLSKDADVATIVQILTDRDNYWINFYDNKPKNGGATYAPTAVRDTDVPF